MSMVIPLAYRFEQQYLKLFVEKCIKIMRPKVDDLVVALISTVEAKDENGKDLTPVGIFDKAYRQIKEAAVNRQWDSFDPSASVSVWMYKDYCYARFFQGWGYYKFEEWMKPSKMNIPSYQDYSYWNNSDPPDDADEEEWESRYDVWDKIDDAHGKIPLLTHYFFSADSWHRTYGLWPMAMGDREFSHVPKKHRKFMKDMLESYYSSETYMEKKNQHEAQSS